MPDNITDRDKVIKGLETVWNGMNAIEHELYADYVYEALELLKDDETQLQYRSDIIYEEERETARLRKLLKEQEPIPCGEKIKAGDVMLDFYECGYCKNAIRKPWKYCPFCGKAVKWE